MSRFTVKKEFDSLYEYLMSFKGLEWSTGPDRSEVKHAMSLLNWTLVHDEPGRYDPSVDGFMVYQDPDTDELWRIDFYDDSYSSGSLEGVRQVTAKTKTVTVYD